MGLPVNGPWILGRFHMRWGTETSLGGGGGLGLGGNSNLLSGPLAVDVSGSCMLLV